MEQIVMSRKEREKLSVFARLKDRLVSRREAAEMLGLSLRQVHRMYRRYLSQGDGGLVHQSRGRASPRRSEESERLNAMTLYRSTYRSFGPTFFAEKLGKDHGIWVSHDTVRRWLVAEGLLEKTRRGRRSRRRRLRKERFGQMVQMDGSHHAWFEERGNKCCLMVIVDDATGRMLGRFYEGETLVGAMDIFRRWCERSGVPRPACPAAMRHRARDRCWGSLRSRGIDHPMALHDGAPADGIANAAHFNDIHFASEHRPQFILNVGGVFEGETVARLEFEHNVHVAVGAEVVAQYGPEQRELRDAVFVAEFFDLLCWQFDV
jgi:transposase